MRLKKNKKAFSLIELSIVILIIGILIAGVVQGRTIINKSRLSNAQTLTKTSPVNDIPNLMMWLETSLPSSFIKSEARDANKISTWHDNSPQAVNRMILSQLASDNQPKFYEDVFNGAIPAIRFDGLNDFMEFDGTALINSGYAIFIVEQRRVANSLETPFIGGTLGSLTLSYKNNTTVTQSHYGNDLDYTIAGYVNPTPRIHTFLFNSTIGKQYWLNGGINPDKTEAGQTASLSSYNGSALGRSGFTFFNGDIAEIIIFTRALKSEEKQLVENYLSKKYNIAIAE